MLLAVRCPRVKSEMRTNAVSKQGTHSLWRRTGTTHQLSQWAQQQTPVVQICNERAHRAAHSSGRGEGRWRSIKEETKELRLGNKRLSACWTIREKWYPRARRQLPAERQNPIASLTDKVRGYELCVQITTGVFFTQSGKAKWSISTHIICSINPLINNQTIHSANNNRLIVYYV